MITLVPKGNFKLPIEGKNVTPDIFTGKSVKEIEALEMWEGNRKRTIGDLFEVKDDGTSSEEFTIKIEGNIRSVRNIGTQMSKGQIIVDGDVGMHLR